MYNVSELGQHKDEDTSHSFDYTHINIFAQE